MPEKTHTLSIFHAITGCDTTSKLKVKREKIAWETRNAFPDVPQALLPLMLCRHCYPWCSAGTATPDVLQALLPLMFCRHCYPWCSAGIPVPDVLQALLPLMFCRHSYPWCSAGIPIPDVLQAFLSLMFCRHSCPWWWKGTFQGQLWNDIMLWVQCTDNSASIWL